MRVAIQVERLTGLRNKRNKLLKEKTMECHKGFHCSSIVNPTRGFCKGIRRDRADPQTGNAFTPLNRLSLQQGAIIHLGNTP
jgi:hypothetical protein